MSLFSKNFKKLIFRMVFCLVAISFNSDKIFSAQYEDYPIIFIHGHGGTSDIEDSWKGMVEGKLNGTRGYSNYGKIWEGTILPKGLSNKSIFLFGFYRKNELETMSNTKGKIGGIPISENDITSLTDVEISVNTLIFPIVIPWYTAKTIDYKNDYFDTTRVSYAARLKKVVESVLESTNSKKVILVTHSMGGLVARSYIRWLGGESKVYKLLTIGAPNHGIADDGRAAMEKITNSSTWQFGGEYVEMSTRKNFLGKSFTETLNDGWSEFCKENGVRYATLAGNYSPWPWPISIGSNSDGVIDRDSVTLSGAEFNGLFPMAHVGNFVLSTVTSGENMLESPFTQEVIKRWVFRDETLVTANLSEAYPTIPNPNTGKFCFWYVTPGNPILARIKLYTLSGAAMMDEYRPLFYGEHAPVIDLSSKAPGVYLIKANAYDINGQIYAYSGKITRVSGGDPLPISPLLSLTSAPQESTTSRDASFQISSNYSSTTINYKIDDGASTVLGTGTSLKVESLKNGLHTIYFSSKTYTQGSMFPDEYPLIYTWLIKKQDNIIVENKLFSTESEIIASKSITTQGDVIIKNGASVQFKAGNEIWLKPGFKAEQGSFFRSNINN